MEGTFNSGYNMEQFDISNSTGALTSAANVNSLTDRGGVVTSDAQSQFVFVAYSAPSTNMQGGCLVASYSIGANGQLTLADQEKMPPNNHCDTVESITVDQPGTHVYVSGTAVLSTGLISTYTVDRSTGKMVNSAPDVSLTGVALPGKIVIHPNGLFAYASRLTPHHYPGQGGWSFLLRDPATGALTDTGKIFNQPTYPNEYKNGVFVLGGKYLFDTAGGEYSAYSVDPATGDLTFVGKQVGDFWDITADQGGNYVIINQQSGPVQSYRVNADGTLTPAGGGTAASANNASFIPPESTLAFDRSGRYIYAESLSTAQIFAFTFNSGTGAMAAVSGSPFSTKAPPQTMTVAGH